MGTQAQLYVVALLLRKGTTVLRPEVVGGIVERGTELEGFG